MPPLRFCGGSHRPHTPRKRWQGHTHGALYPNRENAKGRLRRSTARKVYRKDAKGGAAHSVRDRLTAPLAKPLRLWGAKWEWPQPPSPPHRHCLSIAYLSGRCVTCHLQARRRRVPRGRSPPLPPHPRAHFIAPDLPCSLRARAQGFLSARPLHPLPREGDRGWVNS